MNTPYARAEIERIEAEHFNAQLEAEIGMILSRLGPLGKNANACTTNRGKLLAHTFDKLWEHLQQPSDLRPAAAAKLAVTTAGLLRPHRPDLALLLLQRAQQILPRKKTASFIRELKLELSTAEHSDGTQEDSAPGTPAKQSATPPVALVHDSSKTAAVLLEAARQLATRAGIDPTNLYGSELAKLAGSARKRGDVVTIATELVGPPRADLGSELDEALDRSHRLGTVLDRLRRTPKSRSQRKQDGAYFTDVTIARQLVERAVAETDLRDVMGDCGFTVLDWAVGGAALLLEAAAALLRNEGVEDIHARHWAVSLLRGVDISPLSVATAEVALWLFVGDGEVPVDFSIQLQVGDTLLDAEFPFADADWIVGNPPWVSFKGRASQPLSEERRNTLRQRYSAFRGNPSLHGPFVERAAELAPSGVISILLPSSVSYQKGYYKTREALRGTHAPVEPLLEFGEDATPGVVQPCFGLVATPNRELSERGDWGRPWRLAERAQASADGTQVSVPECLQRLTESPRLPPTTFADRGFRSGGQVTAQLLAKAPSGPFTVPLLEGKVVQEFRVSSPQLFLHPDEAVLHSSHCRLPPETNFQEVDFAIRQTAPYTIAALHNGSAFRNSLLAGYASPELTAPLLVGLLNSSLYRSLHLARARDARQRTFPQVKIGALRALPAPPEGHQRQLIEAVTIEARALAV